MALTNFVFLLEEVGFVFSLSSFAKQIENLASSQYFFKLLICFA